MSDVLRAIEAMLEYKSPKKDAVTKIIEFFEDNPTPDDDKVHELAESLGIDNHKFESIIYGILGSFIGFGEAKKEGFTKDDADPKELAMGIKIEMEHTNSKLIAERIALDHLAEFGDYYTRLHKMESEAEG